MSLPLLVRIFPTPVYRILSDTWHQSLEYIYSIKNYEERIVSSTGSMDPSTLNAIRWGFTVGILLITYLEFYPGLYLLS